MGYIKGGIVTRIENINSENILFVKEFFDLSLFDKVDNCYLLKNEILKNNLYGFRKEFLDFTNYKGDSLCNCEAYCLEIDVDEMLSDNIILTNDNKRFYFEHYNSLKFDTDYVLFSDENVSFGIYFIAVFWDINAVEAEDFNIITYFVNRLTKKALNNQLKGACWIYVI